MILDERNWDLLTRELEFNAWWTYIKDGIVYFKSIDPSQF